MVQTCENCGFKVTTDPFCGGCGQKQKTKKFRPLYIIHIYMRAQNTPEPLLSPVATMKCKIKSRVAAQKAVAAATFVVATCAKLEGILVPQNNTLTTEQPPSSQKISALKLRMRAKTTARRAVSIAWVAHTCCAKIKARVEIYVILGPPSCLVQCAAGWCSSFDELSVLERLLRSLWHLFLSSWVV